MGRTEFEDSIKSFRRISCELVDIDGKSFEYSGTFDELEQWAKASRKNLPERDDSFEAYLVSRGYYPSDFSDDHWEAMLINAGMDDPADRAAYLIGAAEWQE